MPIVAISCLNGTHNFRLRSVPFNLGIFSFCAVVKNGFHIAAGQACNSGFAPRNGFAATKMAVDRGAEWPR